jgi:hypothetical protein
MAEPSKKRKRSARFTIESTGDDNAKKLLFEKVTRVRDILTQRLQKHTSNGEVFDAVLDFWLKNNDKDSNKGCVPERVCSYVAATQDKTDQPLYVCAKQSLEKLVQIADSHGRHCNTSLEIKKSEYHGHVGMLRLACQKKAGHSYQWSSSPYLPNSKFLVNERIQHSFGCSGMLPSHYMRFSRAGGIGYISKHSRTAFYKTYKDSVENVYNDSVAYATMYEMGLYDIPDATDFPGIQIITDARHGWRKNAKDSSVCAVGVKSGKVLHHEHITTAQLPAAQSHEKLGTQHIYEHFEKQLIPVAVHVHDRNASVNKYVREHQPYTVNQNDRWHAIKNVKKKMTEVSDGALKRLGTTWHPQLNDKVEKVGNHFYWALANCEGSASNLRMSLDNIVDHYQNNHGNCSATSRCRTDPSYEPSTKVISDENARKLLVDVVRKSVIYQHPEDFVHAMDTGIIESFHNTMNIFHDKRIAFGSAQYLSRSQLAVCHWNENVGRDYTSVWIRSGAGKSRRRRIKKVYKDCTYNYSADIWKNYIHSVYV